MIGRALDGEIERQLHAVLGRGVAQPAKIVERAERGVDRVVAALRAADRIGAARIARLGVRGVVAALAVYLGRSGGSAGNRARRNPSRGSPAAARSRRRRCRGGRDRPTASAETARTSWRTRRRAARPRPGIRSGADAHAAECAQPRSIAAVVGLSSRRRRSVRVRFLSVCWRERRVPATTARHRPVCALLLDQTAGPLPVPDRSTSRRHVSFRAPRRNCRSGPSKRGL